MKVIVRPHVIRLSYVFAQEILDSTTISEVDVVTKSQKRHLGCGSHYTSPGSCGTCSKSMMAMDRSKKVCMNAKW